MKTKDKIIITDGGVRIDLSKANRTWLTWFTGPECVKSDGSIYTFSGLSIYPDGKIVDEDPWK